MTKRIRDAGAGMVGLVGVQSNQFPRALDLARRFRANGLTVMIGGFHVSGCIAMLPALPNDLQEALDLGILLFAGEAEGRMDEVLRDIDGAGQADLQIPQRHAGNGGGGFSDPAARGGHPRRRALFEL